MFQGPLDESIIKRAREQGILDLKLTDLRDFTHDKHRTVDGRPFGGGPGMLLKPEPIFEAVESLRRPLRWATTVVPVSVLCGRALVTSAADRREPTRCAY